MGFLTTTLGSTVADLNIRIDRVAPSPWAAAWASVILAATMSACTTANPNPVASEEEAVSVNALAGEGDPDALAETLSAQARDLEKLGKYREAEDVIGRIMGLYPARFPVGLARRRLVYHKWLVRNLNQQGRHSEAADAETQVKELEGSLGEGPH